MMYEKNISLLREKKFFSLFDNLAEKAVKAAELLVFKHIESINSFVEKMSSSGD